MVIHCVFCTDNVRVYNCVGWKTHVTFWFLLAGFVICVGVPPLVIFSCMKKLWITFDRFLDLVNKPDAVALTSLVDFFLINYEEETFSVIMMVFLVANFPWIAGQLVTQTWLITNNITLAEYKKNKVDPHENPYNDGTVQNVKNFLGLGNRETDWCSVFRLKDVYHV